MKKFNFGYLVGFLFILSIVIASCDKDDDFHQISTIERAIHTKVNAYRSSKSLEPLVEQFLMFEEARKISNKMANGTYDLGDTRIGQDVTNYMSLLGGDSNGWITLASNIENADSIVNAMIAEPTTRSILEGSFTQSGVGVTLWSDGLYYVCHMFINIP